METAELAANESVHITILVGDQSTAFWLQLWAGPSRSQARPHTAAVGEAAPFAPLAGRHPVPDPCPYSCVLADLDTADTKAPGTHKSAGHPYGWPALKRSALVY